MRLKRIATLVVALIFALAAAFGAAQSARQTTLVIGGDWGDLLTIDPGVSYEFSGTVVIDNIYERLVKFEGADLSKIVPGLAESWEITPRDDGGNSITFHLRDAKFSTGRPVKASDVVFSFDRAIQIAGPGSFLFTDTAGMQVGSTVAVDDKTVRLDLPEGKNPTIVLNLLTFNIGGVMDQAEVEPHFQDGDYGQTWLNDNSAGSGPYKLERWDRSAQVVLVANPEYPDPGPITRVIMRYMQESNAQRTALESGEIDIAWDYTPEAFQAAAGNPDLKTYKTDTFQMTYLGMNSGEGAPFADNRVRDAVRYAVDQQGIIDSLLLGLGRRMQTIIPAGLMGADTTIYYERDVEKAKSLLAEAGATGLTVEFLVPTGACGGGIPCADLAAKIQSDLAEAGITANIKQTVSSELYTIYRAQAAQLVLAAWSPDYPDPDGNATSLASYAAKSIAWRNVWDDAEASELAGEAATTIDVDARKALYAKLTKLVATEGPYEMLYQPYKPVVTSAKVEGFERSAQGDVEFERISKLP
ncbi:MAG TPA: ABC transporter substrate-binding protein [Trueperaceae bacterium]|nr:ABC transporter substrate-binding protein [Trueperaceae bacterium]